MNISWQDIVTLGLIAAATIYIVYRMARVVRRKGMPDCGCCSQCPSHASHDKPLIVLEDRQEDNDEDKDKKRPST
jgi:hypothetical protein